MQKTIKKYTAQQLTKLSSETNWDIVNKDKQDTINNSSDWKEVGLFNNMTEFMKFINKADSPKENSKKISIRLDKQVLDFYKSYAKKNHKKYQTQMKDILRAYMEIKQTEKV